MKKLLAVVVAWTILGLMWSAAWAATVTFNLSWSVTNTPTVPATQYRIDELVAGNWTTVATVPATQLTYAVTGRAVGTTATFSVMPLNNGTEGTRSESSICGTVPSPPPTTILIFSCTPTVVQQ